MFQNSFGGFPRFISPSDVVGGVAAIGGNTIYYYNDYNYHVFTATGTFTVTNPGIVDALILGGGGSGGGGNGGGGGAGGILTITDQIVIAKNYTVTVGSGGTEAGADNSGNKGQNSVFNGATAYGGGGGGGWYGHANMNGGCGAGGEGRYPTFYGTGTLGQGYNGFANVGGGGGTGSAATSGSGGDGTSKYSSSWGMVTNTGYFYLGVRCYGGGGGGSGGGGGTGGGGGGGTDGTTNTGGGGGGGGSSAGGHAGGSGLVIIRYRV